jgi:hypothetical protein
VIGFNGKPGKTITHAIYPKLDIQGHVDNVLLYITQLHRPVILGKSWMAKHGVKLDLTKDSMDFKEGHCQHSNSKKRPLLEGSLTALENNQQHPDKVIKPQANLQRTQRADVAALPGGSREVLPANQEPKAAPQPITSLSLSDRQPKDQKPGRRGFAKGTRSRELASVCMIGAAPFVWAAKQKGSQVFSISMQDIYAEQQRRAQPPEPAECDPALLPEEFRSRAEAFSKKAANQLPPHRDSDHHITLEKEASAAQLGHAPLYRMSDEELRLCKEYTVLTSTCQKGLSRLARRHSRHLCCLYGSLVEDYGSAWTTVS